MANPIHSLFLYSFIAFILFATCNCLEDDQCACTPCHANQTCSVGCPVSADCQPNCKNQNPICFTPICLPKNKTAYCHCGKNYVLGPKGNCILEKDCPRKTCAYTHCHGKHTMCSVGCPVSYQCQPSCRNSNPNCFTPKCSPQNKTAYCHCKKNYVLGPKGNCILAKDCPGKSCIEHKKACGFPRATNCCPPYTCHIDGIDAGYCELPNETTEKPCIAPNKPCGVPRNRNCCPPYTCHITEIDAGYCSLSNKTTEKPCIAHNKPCYVPFRNNCCHPYTCHITGKDAGYCVLPKIITT